MNGQLWIGQDINTGLQTWYDANPNHLTLVLSFGSGEERFVRHLLSPELQSREDHQRISMPLLTREEALVFVQDLLRHFRRPGAPSEWSPFTQKRVKTVIDWTIGSDGVTPRVLMKAFDAVLSEADFQIGTRGMFELSDAETRKIVEEAMRQLRKETEELEA